MVYSDGIWNDLELKRKFYKQELHVKVSFVLGHIQQKNGNK